MPQKKFNIGDKVKLKNDLLPQELRYYKECVVCTLEDAKQFFFWDNNDCPPDCVWVKMQVVNKFGHEPYYDSCWFREEELIKIYDNNDVENILSNLEWS